VSTTSSHARDESFRLFLTHRLNRVAGAGRFARAGVSRSLPRREDVVLHSDAPSAGSREHGAFGGPTEELEERFRTPFPGPGVDSRLKKYGRRYFRARAGHRHPGIREPTDPYPN